MLEDRDWEIRHGDTLNLLRGMPDRCVQTCVTSPPYWGLRSYLPNGHADKPKEMGSEQSPDEYVARMVEVFAEVRRVLRDDGTLWLNLGDCYSTCFFSHDSIRNIPQPMGDWCKEGQRIDKKDRSKRGAADSLFGLKPKDLIGMPWRVLFALQADGYWARSDIIWSKPNPMPESVTDRPTKAHEYLFLLAKSERYYYDAEAIREKSGEPKTRGKMTKGGDPKIDLGARFKELPLAYNPSGRNKRTVWTIATESFSGAHFATFPTKLVEPCILAGSSPKACPVCGAPWRRVVEREGGKTNAHFPQEKAGIMQTGGKLSSTLNGIPGQSITTGWAPTCSHDNYGSGKSIVLDPFSGSGTTVMVALRHGRKGLGLELNPDYVKMSKRRIINDNPMFNGLEMRI